MSMLKITAHAIVRYAERIKKVRVIKHDLHNISNKKIEQYRKEINKIYQFSKVIYVGEFKNHSKACYRIADDIMLVTNIKDNTIITLYRVDFGLLDRKENKKVKEDILYKLEDEKKNMRRILKKKDSKVLQEYEKRKNNYNNLAEQICYSVISRKNKIA